MAAIERAGVSRRRVAPMGCSYRQGVFPYEGRAHGALLQVQDVFP